jgi:hypothetical protein
MLLARASYPYTWNQRRASHARALRGTAASIPNPEQLRSLRSGLGPVCARGYPARGKSTARARKVRVMQNGGCRQKAHRPLVGEPQRGRAEWAQRAAIICRMSSVDVCQAAPPYRDLDLGVRRTSVVTRLDFSTYGQPRAPGYSRRTARVPRECPHLFHP